MNLKVWSLILAINITEMGFADKLKARTNDFKLEINPDMVRTDLTMKSNQGYLGQIKDNKGYTMTEQSIDVEIDGKKVLMPLLVPGLNNEEINAIKAGKDGDPILIKSAEDKAIEHGKQRIKEGKSPFFEDKPQSITLESDEVPIGNMGKEVKINNNDKFYSLVKTLENSVKAGFDKETNTWKPHKSLEGGRATVAWGHKLTPEEAKGNYVMVGDTKVSLDTGLTNEQADTLFKQDMDIAKTEAKKFIGEGFDGLSNKQQLLATELFYNLGANKAKQYKNFKEKILAGDESFINEIDRGYKDDKGQRQLLTDRTDPLKEWYASE